MCANALAACVDKDGVDLVLAVPEVLVKVKEVNVDASTTDIVGCS